MELRDNLHGRRVETGDYSLRAAVSMGPYGEETVEALRPAREKKEKGKKSA